MNKTVLEGTKIIIVYDSFLIETTRLFDFRDVTEEIQEIITKSGVKNGQITVQMSNTTARIFINENESGLIEKDFLDTLERVASSKNTYYRHDDFKLRTQNITDEECANGHSHCKALFLPFSVNIIIKDGKMRLGRWGRIMLVELDHARNDRMVEVSIIGSGE